MRWPRPCAPAAHTGSCSLHRRDHRLPPFPSGQQEPRGLRTGQCISIHRESRGGDTAMKPGASPIERFNGWYVKPIEALEKLPEGDGAFAALMIALPLYERYIDAKLKLAGEDRTEENKQKEAGEDLGLDDRHRGIFLACSPAGPVE